VRLLWESAEAECVEMRSEDFSVRGVRAVRADPNTTPEIPTNEGRGQEEEKTMARRKLTEQEMLKGVEKALASKKCPPQLRPGLQRRADSLRKNLGLEPKPQGSGLLALLRK